MISVFFFLYDQFDWKNVGPSLVEVSLLVRTFFRLNIQSTQGNYLTLNIPISTYPFLLLLSSGRTKKESLTLKEDEGKSRQSYRTQR